MEAGEEMESFSRKSSVGQPTSSSLREKLAQWSYSIRDTIRAGVRRASPAAPDSSTNLLEPGASSSSRQTSSTTSDYTELHGGSVPCPSCKGSGLIPKELESTLVALIPVNDERLKPRKTCIYIAIWVGICILVGGILLFLLMPRTVYLDSDRMPIEQVHVFGRADDFIDFYFMNKVNISSGNYLPVTVTNITATVISRFQPWSTDVVGHGLNETFSLLGPLALYRSKQELSFNNTVDLKGVVAQYCQAPFSRFTSLYVSLQFDVAVTLRYYYGHQEQATISMEQQVCCVTSGNCTST